MLMRLRDHHRLMMMRLREAGAGDKECCCNNKNSRHVDSPWQCVFTGDYRSGAELWL